MNVATYCDHTPQFLGLNDLQKEFGADLQIIGVPTDQFHFVSLHLVVVSLLMLLLYCFVVVVVKTLFVAIYTKSFRALSKG